MAWADKVKVLGKDTNKPCGAAALSDGTQVLADTNGVITWTENAATFDRWVTLQANGYVNHRHSFRVRDPVPSEPLTIHLDKYVAPEVRIEPPRDLRMVSCINGEATLQWTNGESYSKVLFRWAVIQPNGTLTNERQVELDGRPTSHRIAVPPTTNLLFSVKGGRKKGSLSWYYSDWCEMPVLTPVRPGLVIHPEVKMRPGATVAALVPRPGHIDLFATGTDGAVWSTWWESAAAWVKWFLIHPEVKMHPGTEVTAYAPPWGNHIDLFATGTDGAVWSTFWQSDTGWVKWFLIHPEVKMRPGATVTARVTRPGHYDLFVTGTDGAVWSTWWEKSTGWVPWFLIRPEVKMHPGATVFALVPWGDNHIDLFATGSDGTVWSTFWPSPTGWVPWFAIHREVRMHPGAPVTALVPRKGHIDLFVTGTDGAVWSTFWEKGTGWVKWFLIRPEVKMQPGAKINAIVPRDGHIDLFSTGPDGTVWSTWWESGTGWVPWFPIHGEAKMQPGASVTPLVPRSNHIDLFVTGKDGAVSSMSWQPDTGW